MTCSVKLATASAVHATFKQGGQAVATRSGRSVSARLTPGRYTLVLRYRSGGRTTTVIQRVRVP